MRKDIDCAHMQSVVKPFQKCTCKLGRRNKKSSNLLISIEHSYITISDPNKIAYVANIGTALVSNINIDRNNDNEMYKQYLQIWSICVHTFKKILENDLLFIKYRTQQIRAFSNIT